ncbi:MAG TPA: zinc-ribbon domain-containing protein [Candidatus Bathyarchaeia archaeon]|nr:zinc-ribbon domain-containing protein [Candidatus Bathyarchaeia archaeon]
MPTTPFYRKEDVENKTVLDTSGKSIGIAQDMAFSIDGKLALAIKPSKGEVIDIPMTRVIGVSDYIVVTPEVSASTQPVQPSRAQASTTPVSPVQQTCPSCGKLLKLGTKFCTGCGVRLSSLDSSHSVISSKSDGAM